ncbi:NAD(P)/FAD-dependent oxidoreductase [Rugamonas apoptosis]|uniref:NAD(P)/FAD-dependent oxidoreductase n=1 Tax=Rugamonas apoptosis TaxID=2758570 RepID=A0A7W2FD60_9BURK|nr:NAD(P)/FAD-dependent oxidoreductase [Rugamonas apoptosis]MBA5689542.1 NAD(P)/FAD-dependent oxidoreductase [Rugamonas apoptosis]
METIVIVGGGAGGLELATRLGDTLGKSGHARVLLIDRTPGHFWKPLLHTVASGKCDPRVTQVEFAAQAAAHHFDFVQGDVLAVDRANRTIELAPRCSGGLEVQPRRSLPYDKLVLALGSVTNFFNVPGAADHVLTLENVNQAEAFRKRFVAACIQAGERKARGDHVQGQVHVVIVGGGATGVELAAELSHSARALAQYKVHALDPSRDVRISVIERGKFLLPHLHPRQSVRAARHLASLGIEVLTETVVASVAPHAVHDATGHAHRADLTLWAAGVEGPALCGTLGLPVNRINQIVVDAKLRASGDAAIYALGDCASYTCPVKGVVPPRAQVAHQQAVFLSDLLARRDVAEGAVFHYRDYGSLVSLGPLAAVGVLSGAVSGRRIQVSGATARLLYRLLYQKHLLALHGISRMAVHTLVDWLRAKLVPPVKLH